MEEIHPEYFGAVPNGTTDCTTAIQNSINALSAGRVVFSTGNYLHGAITLKPSVELVGAGINNTILSANADSINMYQYSAASIQTHFNISNASLKANGHSSVSAIKIDGVDSSKRCSNIRLKDLYFEYMNSGIYLHYTANAFIENIFGTQTTTGIRLSFAADSDLANCKIQNGSGPGFYIDGGTGAYDEGIRLVNCSTNGQTKGLEISNQEWGICTGCSFTTCSGGALIMGGSSDWKFTNNEFSVAGTPSNPGANLSSTCNNIIFAGNFFATNTFGVVIGGDRNVVVGNIFVNGTNVDIMINGATYSTISANVCDSTGVSQSIYEAGGSDYNNINGNTINGTVFTSGSNSTSTNNLIY